MARTAVQWLAMAEKNNAPLGSGGVNQTLAAGGMLAPPILPTPRDIARGSAGDCCILCGKVGIDLPLVHGCRPNIDVDAYRAQPKQAQRVRRTRWDR